MASSRTAPQTPKTAEAAAGSPGVAAHQAAAPVVVPTRRGPMALVIGGVLIVVLLVVVVGGLLVWNSMRATPPDTNGPGGPGANPNTSGEVATTKEIARYWLEVSPDKTAPLRVVPTIPVKSGQFFKFHFTPNEDGYLYIVGPGGNNKLTAFLTEKPDQALTGWSNNSVKKGVDFSFPMGSEPDGAERFFKLDTSPGAETYAFIFSLTPLTSPRFLGAKATGYLPNDTEQAEWNAFLAKYKTNPRTIDVNTSDSAAPFVAVRLPASSKSGEPLVLDFRIEHK